MANASPTAWRGCASSNAPELCALEPNIADEAVAALWGAHRRHRLSLRLTYALAENAAKNGVRFQFDTEGAAHRTHQGGWRLETSRGPLEGRCIVNAAGVHADELHIQVSGDTMTIIPRRGDYFLLDRTAGDHVHHTIFQLPGKYGKGVLVTPTVHGNLLIGPTATDIPDKEDTATTADELAEVRAKGGPGREGPSPAPDHHQLCGAAGPRGPA